MKLNTHANLLSIFSFVVGGLQLLLTLFFGVYVLFVGLAAVVTMFDPNAGKDGEAIVFILLTVVFGVLTLFGLISFVTNFIMGFKLRKPFPVGKKMLVFASVLNCLNFMFGGVLAIGLGGYGLWFSFSDEGRSYFAGNVMQPEPVYNFPPAPAQYGTGTPHQQQHNEPYRWK